MIEKVDLWFSFRQTFQKVRDSGGTAASEPIMPLPKRAERFTLGHLRFQAKATRLDALGPQI